MKEIKRFLNSFLGIKIFEDGLVFSYLNQIMFESYTNIVFFSNSFKGFTIFWNTEHNI